MFKKAMTSFKIVGSFLMISFFIVISSAQAQDSLHVDTLIAYYPFSGSAMDSSGFGNDGEVFGATLTEDRFGNPNSAYSFDGEDDFIEISDDSVFNSQTKTIEFWFKKDVNSTSASDVEGIIWKALNTGKDRVFSYTVTNQSSPYDFYSNSGNQSDTLIHTVTEQSIYPGRWYQGVGVIDSSMVKLYLNGVLVDSVVHNGGIINNGAPIAIGKTQGYVPGFAGGSRHFEGAIDDISFYNYALSDSAIQKLYIRGGWPLPEDTTDVLADTLVAYYPFSGSAVDSSGFGNDGEVFGATLTEDRFGNPNSAYAFDGVDDYINTNTTFNYPNRSISVWVKVDYDESTVQNRQTILEQDSGHLTYGAMGLYFRNQMFDFREGNTEDTWPQPALQKDTWSHLTMTRSDTVVKGYLNGQLVGIGIADNNGSFSNPFNEVRIGANREWNLFLKGAIDDISFYNYALSDSAIQKLYTKGGWPLPEDTTAVLADTLVAYYPFSGSAMDSSGFGNNGEVFGATLTEDRFGNPNSAYAFDGSNDFIEISDNMVFNSQSKTIEFWFKKDINSTSSSDVEGIIWKALNTGTDRVFSYTVTNKNSPYDFYSNSGNQTDLLVRAVTEQSIYPGRWYQGVGVIDSSVVKLYLNGVLVDSVVHNGGIVNNSAPIVIGKTQGFVPGFAGGTRHFEGAIDDVQIYNYALSDSAIHKNYTRGGWPGLIVPPDAMVAYYTFDGDTLDHSGYDNQVAVYGASLTKDRNEKPDQSFLFDGENDYIKIANPSGLSSLKNLSVSFWAQGVSKDTSFTGVISKPDFMPFGVAIDDGDRMFFNVSSDSIPLNLMITNLNTNPERWYQYVAVYSANEYLKLYRDGDEIGSLHDSNPNYIDLDDMPIYIGATILKSEELVDTTFFAGGIDDIRFYNYALSAKDVEELFAYETGNIVSNESRLLIPEQYQLYQNYPNPFNPSTNIKFDLPQSGFVSLKVFDISGRLVSTLVNEVRPSGAYTTQFDASHLASGIYLYKLSTKDFSMVKKLTLIK